MSRIAAVNWDVDKVWYPSLSTSYCAEASPLDPQPYLDRFLNEGWFEMDDVKRWAEYANKDTDNPIQSVGDMAACLTDFLYKIKKGDDSVITKQQTIEGKQSLLKGLRMKDIREIADNVELTPGLRESIHAFRKDGIYQVAFSDGLGPFIAYMARKEGMNYAGIVPAIIELYGEEDKFAFWHIDADDVILTGRAEKFNKSEAFFEHMKEMGYDLKNVAAIDDSSANVPTLKKVQDAGGVSIGFNPTDAHEPKFMEAGIPILKQDERSLDPFKEIVLDPSEATIGKYCV